MGGRRAGRGGDSGQGLAVLWHARRLCARLLIGGMVWHTSQGSRLEMSAEIRGARDFREGRQHLPHPTLAAITNLTPRPHNLEIADSGGWRPGVLGKEHTVTSMDVSLRKQIFDASVRDGVDHVFDENGHVGRDFTDATFMDVGSLTGDEDGRQRVVRVGDDVACTYETLPAWYTVRRMLVVRTRQEVRLWMWPEWWYTVENMKHPMRQTVLVQRSSVEEREQAGFAEYLPVQPTLLHRQVSLVHSCKREGATATVRRRVGTCKEVVKCPDHQLVHLSGNGCPQEGCTLKGRKTDLHDYGNTYYEVFDSQSGFSGAAKKVRECESWIR